MTRKTHSIHRVSTALACALVLGCTFVLPSCGGGSGGGSSPTSSSTPPPTVRSVILQATFSGLQPWDLSEEAALQPFVSAAGDLDITVDWTLASNDVDVFLARGTLEQAQSAACEQDTPECPLELVAQVATLSKPETLSGVNVAAGSYLVIVVNLGTTTESGVIVVGFTA